MSFVKRAPGKRRIKQRDFVAMNEQLAGEGEGSSDDSDFDIREFGEVESDDSNASSNKDKDDCDVDSGSKSSAATPTPTTVTKGVSKSSKKEKKAANEMVSFTKELIEKLVASSLSKKVIICYVCLGGKSDPENQILVCASCETTVHEGCYGKQNSYNISPGASSSTSSSAIKSWFCDPCCAGVTDPVCELCPNSGGVFKETNEASWVHVVCAHYIIGVESTQRDAIELSAIPLAKWGDEPCHYCPDRRFKGTGVTIRCEMPFCRVSYHVTCGQGKGLLFKLAGEKSEKETSDTLCAYHASNDHHRQEKKDNWKLLETRREKMYDVRKSNEFVLERKVQMELNACREEYERMKALRPPPYIPENRSAQQMSTNMTSPPQYSSLFELIMSLEHKWDVKPAFNHEYMGFHRHRKQRMSKMKNEKSELDQTQTSLLEEIYGLHNNRKQMKVRCKSGIQENKNLVTKIEMFHSLLNRMKNEDAKLMDDQVKNITAELKDVDMVVGTEVDDVDGTNGKCSICKGMSDEKLMTICDACNTVYHIGCLNPPLHRKPRKTKFQGWQCSECDKNDDAGSGVDLWQLRKTRLNVIDYKETSPNASPSMITSVGSSPSSVLPTTSAVKKTGGHSVMLGKNGKKRGGKKQQKRSPGKKHQRKPLCVKKEQKNNHS